MRFWRAPEPFDAGAPVDDEALEAVFDDGRFVVECPTCRGAQATTVEDPRFMCNLCGNAATEGRWRPVTWPGGPDGMD